MKIEKINGINVLSTGKRLDAIDGPKMKGIVKELAEESSPKLVVDMGQTLTLDSSGCGSLISAFKTLLNNNGEMKIARPNPQCLEILRLTRLYRIFEIHDTIEAAVQSFR